MSLMAAPRKGCTHQAAIFLSEEDASSSEEDTESSVLTRAQGYTAKTKLLFQQTTWLL